MANIIKRFTTHRVHTTKVARVRHLMVGEWVTKNDNLISSSSTYILLKMWRVQHNLKFHASLTSSVLKFIEIESQMWVTKSANEICHRQRIIIVIISSSDLKMKIDVIQLDEHKILISPLSQSLSCLTLSFFISSLTSC
jgi:hypothetical protein